MLVAKRNKVDSLEAVGSADIANRKPMRTDSLFWIASQSKPITAAALMILVDEGKVNVDDPVEKYLPEFRGQMIVAENDGKRYLSQAAVKQMTSKQTPKGVPSAYGFGFSTGGDRFGHGGTYSTNSDYDRKHGLILIWLVRHASFPGNGGKAQDTFRRAALGEFGH